MSEAMTEQITRETSDISLMNSIQKSNKSTTESVKISITRSKTMENFEIFFIKHDKLKKGWLNYDEFQEMLNDYSQNEKLTREQRDRCFVYVNESESGKITLEEACKRLPDLKEKEYTPEIKPELLEMILSQPPDQEVSVEEMVNVGWDVIGTITDPEVNPNDYFEILEEKLPGALTKVYKCREKETGTIYALKIIDLVAAGDGIYDFQNELAFQVSCDSPYIAKYYHSFLYEGQFWVIMEYLGAGSLTEILKAGPLSESEIRVAVRGIARAMTYLHSRDLIHRDIKCSNVMMNEKGEVKISDFKVATAMNLLHDTFAGTPLWIAPEIILGYPFEQKSDIWSLGITCLEMAYGAPPYSDLTVMDALTKIPLAPPPKLEGDFSDTFKDFVSACLKKDPKERFSAIEILCHPFLSYQSNEPSLASLINRAKGTTTTSSTTAAAGKVNRYRSVRKERSGTQFSINTVDTQEPALNKKTSKYVAASPKKTRPPAISSTSHKHSKPSLASLSPRPHAHPSAIQLALSLNTLSISNQSGTIHPHASLHPHVSIHPSAINSKPSSSRPRSNSKGQKKEAEHKENHNDVEPSETVSSSSSALKKKKKIEEKKSTEEKEKKPTEEKEKKEKKDTTKDTTKDSTKEPRERERESKEAREAKLRKRKSMSAI